MDWLYEELLSFFLRKGIGILQGFKLKRKIKRTSENIRTSVCQKYESEKYFLHLDGFIHTNKFVYNFIADCLSSNAVWTDCSIKAYCNKRLDNFIEDYPEHSIDRNNISECMEYIIRIIITNLCKIDDPNVVNAVTSIKKHIDISFDCLKSEIDRINEKTDKMADQFENIIFQNMKNDVECIPMVMNIAFTPPELNEKYISYREEYISSVIMKLNSCFWYHIVGSAWSGKTYASLLLRRKCKHSIWLDLSRGNKLNTISLLVCCIVEN